MKKSILLITVAVTISFLIFFWIGFFFPNPTFDSLNIWSLKKIILWAPRIFIPILIIGILFIIFTRNRQLAKNIILLFGTISFTCILGAFLLYIFYKSPNSKRKIIEQYHPFLQLNPPSIDLLNDVKSDGHIKIFCLGGSTTEFGDKLGGWPARLQMNLRQYYGYDSIYVYNFGKQWYTTLHTLINYETNLRHHKPDVIIIMHNINDFLNNADFSYFSKGLFREDYGHFLGPVNNIIKRKGLFGTFWHKLREIWFYKPRTTLDQNSFPGLVSFTRNINTIIDLTELDSTKIVLLTQPNIFSENMDDQTKKACTMVNVEAVGEYKRWSFQTAYLGMKQYNERVAEIAHQRGVYFIDLEKFVPKSLKYFTDDVHYTDTTFNIIGKRLTEKFIDLNIIPR